MFDPDAHFDWTSTRGWRVVRLDAARCENVVQKRVVYPGLQTYEGFHALIKNAGGIDSPGYWSMARGCFPPTGVMMSVIPAGMVVNLRAEVLWYERPTPCAGVDLALQGGDTAVFAKGSFGLATGLKFPPSLEHPNGHTKMFKTTKGRSIMRNVLLLEALLKLPKGDTIAIKNDIVRLARTFSIPPYQLCIDRTGNGQGVFDLLRFEFGEVIGLNYSEGASPTRVMVEDHAPAEELYERAQTEVWFALRKFIEFGYFFFGLEVQLDQVIPQLTNRRFRLQGKRSKVEAKNDYQLRCNGTSPDEADGVTLFVHCVRKFAGFIPGMAPENSTDNLEDFEDEEEENGGVRIDVTNRFEDL